VVKILLFDLMNELLVTITRFLPPLLGEINMDENKLGKTSLIGLVIGSMIGGGAFNIISDMGGQAAPLIKVVKILLFDLMNELLVTFTTFQI
jgi:hypothetical protein